MSTKRKPEAASARKVVKATRRYPLWLTTERIVIGVIVLATVAAIGAIIASTARNGYIQNLNIEGVEVVQVTSAQHTTSTVNYPVAPPAGGPHHPAWQQCGVYTSPIASEHAVHSLEHGAIWITYSSDLPQDQIDKLADITRRSTHRLLSPFEGLESPIVLSAWGYQLRLDNADDSRLMDFILKYEQGPQTPEPGASCIGGETRTLAQIRQG